TGKHRRTYPVQIWTMMPSPRRWRGDRLHHGTIATISSERGSCMFAPHSVGETLDSEPSAMIPDDALRLPDDASKNGRFEGRVIPRSLGHNSHRLSGFVYTHQAGVPYIIAQNTRFDPTPLGAQRRTVLTQAVAGAHSQIVPTFDVTKSIPLIATEMR